MKVRELNIDSLGSKMISLNIASFVANHSYPRSTMMDYIKIEEDDLESQFLLDMLTLKTNEIIEKWYGGEEEVRNYLLKQSKQRWGHDE